MLLVLYIILTICCYVHKLLLRARAHARACAPALHAQEMSMNGTNKSCRIVPRKFYNLPWNYNNYAMLQFQQLLFYHSNNYYTNVCYCSNDYAVLLTTMHLFMPRASRASRPPFLCEKEVMIALGGRLLEYTIVHYSIAQHVIVRHIIITVLVYTV